MKTFLPISLFCLALILSLSLIAQPVNGKLFMDGWNVYNSPLIHKGLSALSYPGGVYQALDSFRVQDMTVDQGMLYVIQRDSSENDTHIKSFDIQSLQETDSFYLSHAKQLAVWNNQFLVASSWEPYRIKAYDISNRQFLWSFNIPDPDPWYFEMLVRGDTLWILLADRLFGCDLQTQQLVVDETIGNTNYRATRMSAKDNKLYITLTHNWERSTVLQYEIANNTFQQLFPFEEDDTSLASYPLVVGDKVYFLNHPTYFDLNQQTLNIYPSGPFQHRAMGYDNQTNTVIALSQYNDTIEYWSAGQLISSRFIPTRCLHAIFVNEQTTHLTDTQFDFELSPSPATSEIRLKSYKKLDEVRLLDLQGRLVQSWKTEPTHIIHKLNLDSHAEGVYLLEVRSGQQSISKKLYIQQ